MDRMTDEHAAELIERIDVLVDAVAAAETQTEETARLAKRLRISFIVAGVVVALLLGGIVYTVRQNQQNAIAACESGNRRLEGTRAEKQEDWRIQDAGAKAQGFGEDSALVQFYADRLRWQLDELYPYRDCTDLSKKIPTPGPPPSFQKALDEALEQEAQE